MTHSTETPTPPFVLWSLEFACIYREESDPSEPERVERVLRPLRASAEAMAEGRCLWNVCIDSSWQPGTPVEQTLGFVLPDTLIPFGNRKSAEQTCGSCPANAAMPPEQQPRWAGCHGLLIANDLTALEARLKPAFNALAADSPDVPPFAETDTVWHGLWLDTPLRREQLPWHARLWERLESEELVTGLASFQRALVAAQSHQLALHVRAYPAGRRTARHWHVPAHCPRCSALREDSATVCSVCHAAEAAVPQRRRLAKGDRPYWQLARFLGDDNAQGFLMSYANHWHQQKKESQGNEPL